MNELLLKVHDIIKTAYTPIRPVCHKLDVDIHLRRLYNRMIGLFADDHFWIETETTRAKLNLKSGGHIHALRNQQREAPVIDDLIQNCEPGDVFYDVGANIGTYSCLVGNSRPEATIIAFEPNKEFRTALEKNLELNSIDALVQDVALSDTDGDVKYQIDWLNRIDPSERSDIQDGQLRTVKQQQGDALIDSGEVPSPDIVKIDVDGGEFKIVQGLKETLSGGNCRLLYIEVHPHRLPDYGHAVADLEEELTELGYTLEQIHDRGEELYWKCSK